MNKFQYKSSSDTELIEYEAEVAEGLEAVARDEISKVIGRQGKIQFADKGAVRFAYSGKPQALLRLQTVIALYSYDYFDVPRPRALLGHEHFQRLLRQIKEIRALSPRGSYETFHLSAAGSDSSVMGRLKEQLAVETKLTHSEDKGDLFIRIRRSRQGWDVLVRLTSRPLATRTWRVCNLEGALNASVARAMALFTKPSADDIFLNIGCGSGSLLVERLEVEKARQAIGCDISVEALACAAENLRASRKQATLLHCDGRQLPLASNSVNVLCADLPFGQLVGTHQENLQLYPALLHEAARVAVRRAYFVVITHEIKLMEALLRETSVWQVESMIRITLGGLHPRIYILRKL
ncbi:MAG: methyltransferase domain-containing protein [Anaerolineae bacterium]